MDEIIFVMKVKLPNPGGYAACPSGDTEYEEAYHKALFDNKPIGFEVHYKRAGYEWPVDNLGFTWVPLFIADEKAEKMALANALARAVKAESSLRNLRKTLREM